MTLGYCAVGKSSFILRFTENKFENTYLTTVGIDSKFRLLNIQDIQYKVLFYDTARQNVTRIVLPQTYTQCEGAALALLMWVTAEKNCAVIE